MNDDLDLLRRFAETGDETAFRQVMERYLPLVHSAAMRQTDGNRHEAEDIVQSVFIDLSRRAGRLGSGVVLAGWLFRATRFAASKRLREEGRRRAREMAAMTSQEGAEVSGKPETDEETWQSLQAHLDEAVLELGDQDRHAILLRYFQNADFRTVGAALNISDDTAQKRVTRALQKLRDRLVQRGVILSVAGLGALLSSRAVSPPPAELAAHLAAALKGASTAAHEGFRTLGGSLLNWRAGVGVGTVVVGILLSLPWLLRNPAPLVTFQLGREFSASTNPSGPWSFGWKATPGGAFTLMPQARNYWSDNRSPLAGWEPSPFQPPSVVRNMGPGPAISANGRFVVPAGGIWMGPGVPGDPRHYAVVRFTAPPGSSGDYQVGVAAYPAFSVAPTGAEDSDLHILQNGVELFSQLIGPDTGVAFNRVIQLSAGDTIELVTGRGNDPAGTAVALVARISNDPAESQPVEIRHAMATPAIAYPPWDQAELAGTSATVEVTAGGAQPLQYQWWADGQPVPGATNAVHQTAPLAPGPPREYFVTIRNLAGAVTSAPARVSVAACVPTADRLVGWWPADESALDRLGGAPGGFRPGTSLAPGRVGQAFRFVGSNAGVRVPASAALDVGVRRGFTIEAWIKPDQTDLAHPLVSWDSEGQAGVVWLVQNNQFVASLMDRRGPRHEFFVKDAVVAAGRWQHVGLTYDRLSGWARFYHNGQVVGEELYPIFPPETRPDLFIGCRPGSRRPMHYNGLIDEFSIYSRALAADEIKAIYNAGAAGKCAPGAPAAGRPPETPGGLAAQRAAEPGR